MAPADKSFGSRAEFAGEMRVVEEGSMESGVEVRMVIHSADAPLFGSVKGPTKLAPASTTMVSPGCAALMAFCKSPPAATVTVAARPALALPAKSIAVRVSRNKVCRSAGEN
jgi:hypothetical protein